MAINEQAIRATVKLGDITVETPYVLSFTVNKVRNGKSTFSASLKIDATALRHLNDNLIVIYAGLKRKQQKIFTGYVLNSTPSPCWDDPKYVVLNISGADVLFRLEHEHYTRRQTSASSRWAIITGVQRKAPKGSQFKLVKENVLLPTDGDIATDDQKSDKQFYITDLSRYGVPISKGPGQNVLLEITNVASGD
jgi:hypothetical protein